MSIPGATIEVEEQAEVKPTKDLTCSHCGDYCPDYSISIGDRAFCCSGCKTVYEILNEHGMDQYYTLEKSPGIKVSAPGTDSKFAYLDAEAVQRKLIRFTDGNTSRILLRLPQIHCSSCIWLLENLSRLMPAVVSSTVQFTRREATIIWKTEEASLRELIEMLASLGYEPDLSSKSANTTRTDKEGKKLLYRIGIAGFCFGNIMLLAFPEYLGIDSSFAEFQKYFAWVSLVLSLPVMFYSGWIYLDSAWKSIFQKVISMDVPIALGMITLFIRSTYEVVSHTGAGYFDSLAGLVFFLLLGRWFQRKTYSALSFERDFDDYFPLAVSRKIGNDIELVELKELEAGDTILLRNGELIPADGVLRTGAAQIDYSFVSGESVLVKRNPGDLLFAGGRQAGSMLEIELTQSPDASYLAQLWQEKSDKYAAPARYQTLANSVSKYFTIIVLLITVGTAIYWYTQEPTKLWNAVTAVLIVACPCALALSIPFAFGTATRVLGKNGLFLRGAELIEVMTRLKTIVFDKTGTLTHQHTKHVDFVGEELKPEEILLIKSMVSNSLHPLSQAILSHLRTDAILHQVDDFREETGKGITGSIGGKEIVIGSAAFLVMGDPVEASVSSEVHVSINGNYRGHFQIAPEFREGLKHTTQELSGKYDLHLLTGDHNWNESEVESLVGAGQVHYRLTPEQKQDYISNLQQQNQIVMMAGDGLNDVGALAQSDVGVAVVEDEHQFSPSCDAILKGKSFGLLPGLLQFSNWAVTVVKLSFAISFLYNVVGLSFAVSGHLSPLVAAILMPLSSITVVAFATGMVMSKSRKIQHA